MITLTDSAAAKVKELLQAEGATDLALRVAVRPGGCSGFQYEMYFDGDVASDDNLATFGSVKVLVDPASAQLLEDGSRFLVPASRVTPMNANAAKAISPNKTTRRHSGIIQPPRRVATRSPATTQSFLWNGSLSRRVHRKSRWQTSQASQILENAEPTSAGRLSTSRGSRRASSSA